MYFTITTSHYSAQAPKKSSLTTQEEFHSDGTVVEVYTTDTPFSTLHRRNPTAVAHRLSFTLMSH